MCIVPSTIACSNCKAPRAGSEPWFGVTIGYADSEMLMRSRWSRDLPILMRYKQHFCSDGCIELGLWQLMPESPDGREVKSNYQGILDSSIDPGPRPQLPLGIVRLER